MSFDRAPLCLLSFPLAPFTIRYPESMRRRNPPIPVGLFLDRSVVALLEDHVEEVFDGTESDRTPPKQLAAQIVTLRVLMAAAGRGGWPFAVSPAVVAQGSTWYADEIADHWRLARAAWGIGERGSRP